MDMTRVRQLMLMALSSEHDNEMVNAIRLAKRALAKGGTDIHDFVNGMGGIGSNAQLSALMAQVAALSNRLRYLEAENQRLQRELSQARSSPRPSPNVDPASFRHGMPGYMFRHGSKRRACFDLLNRPQGATVAEGMAVTGWAHSVVLSEFHEIAKRYGWRVVRSGDSYHFV
jgi:hypothetical protein